jgi:hypothetical protein
MRTKPIGQRRAVPAVLFVLLGALLGFLGSLFLRVGLVTRSPQPFDPDQPTSLAEQLFIAPDLDAVRLWIADDPTSVITEAHGELPIHLAVSVWPGELELLQILVEAGADPLTRGDGMGPLGRHSALSYAAWHGNTSALATMLSSLSGDLSPQSQAEVLRARWLLESEFPGRASQIEWPE